MISPKESGLVCRARSRLWASPLRCTWDSKGILLRIFMGIYCNHQHYGFNGIQREYHGIYNHHDDMAVSENGNTHKMCVFFNREYDHKPPKFGCCSLNTQTNPGENNQTSGLIPGFPTDRCVSPGDSKLKSFWLLIQPPWTIIDSLN